jgi:transposase
VRGRRGSTIEESLSTTSFSGTPPSFERHPRRFSRKSGVFLWKQNTTACAAQCGSVVTKPKTLRDVGLLRPHDPVPDYRVIDNSAEAVHKLVNKLGAASSLFACYEAGPTGCDTFRLLQSLGVRCDVIAPTLIPRLAGQRVKTDRLDARNLARLHRAGELTPIRVPSCEEQALRDLIRVREDLKDDRRRAQQRIKSFLLRQGRHYPWTGTWRRHQPQARRGARQEVGVLGQASKFSSLSRSARHPSCVRVRRLKHLVVDCLSCRKGKVVKTRS